MNVSKLKRLFGVSVLVFSFSMCVHFLGGGSSCVFYSVGVAAGVTD